MTDPELEDFFDEDSDEDDVQETSPDDVPGENPESKDGAQDIPDGGPLTQMTDEEPELPSEAGEPGEGD